MGGASSISSTIGDSENDENHKNEINENDSFHEDITEDDLKVLCIPCSNDHFISETVYQSSLLFNSLSNITGNNLIPYTLWSDLTQNNSEQESLRLFLQFCSRNASSSSPFPSSSSNNAVVSTLNSTTIPTSKTSTSSPFPSSSSLSSSSYLMYLDQYISYCKQIKLLSKHYYTKKAAQSSFNQHSFHHPSLGQYINYYIFRCHLLPFIAKLKHIQIHQMIIRLSRIEPDLITPSAPSSSNTQLLQESIPQQGANTNTEIETSISKQFYAIILIQKLYRSYFAKLHLQHLKKLSIMESKSISSKSYKDLPIILNTTPSLQQSSLLDEEKCYEIYIKYCQITNNEMNITQFIQLCHDTTLIPYGNGYHSEKIDLTKREAKYIFQYCIAMYFIPELNTYREGVIHGKRINYKVYREVVLPAVANWKKITIEEVLKIIINENHHNNGRRIYTREGNGPMVISLLSSSYLNQHILSNHDFS